LAQKCFEYYKQLALGHFIEQLMCSSHHHLPHDLSLGTSVRPYLFVLLLLSFWKSWLMAS
jgi:hypothetical protein